MLGQGRPHAALVQRLLALERRRWFSPGRIRAIGWCALTLLAAALNGEEIDLRLRVTWGDGPPRVWRGSVFVSDGQLSEPRRLGIKADLPGAMTLRDRTLRFKERSATSFDGLDVHIRGQDTTVMTIQLSTDAPIVPQTFEISLRDFIEDPGYVFSGNLDEANRLIVRRAPGDRLRFETARKNLVFGPMEPFRGSIQPHSLGLTAGTGVRCEIQLLTSDGESLWEKQLDRVINEDRGTDPLPLKFDVPAEEGVYTVVIGLSQRRFANALMRGKLLMQRKVQFAVIGTSRAPVPMAAESETPWPVVDEINLADPSWWKQWSWLPQLTPFSSGPRGPVGNDALQPRNHGGESYLELGPEKWYATPLPISRLNAPHILEVEYPSDVPQTLGISLLEPNAAGKMTPLFLDSGIDVQRRVSHAPTQTKVHRLVFWPRTQSPWLVLTNRRSDEKAIFRRIRVLAGPDRLPDMTRKTRAGSLFGTYADETKEPQEERLFAAYYDKPFFAQNFMAPEALEQAPASPRSLNDWRTFLVGGRRLTEYLKYAGYNAAIIAVVRDGSTLYPSDYLESTPRYDNGAFFVSGQDPMSKDILEMLFRLFDREGLKLIPSLHLATPLPELERQLNDKPSSAQGIELADSRGRTWASSSHSQSGLAPYYNPLDKRVQAAVGKVVGELVQRYAHHPSFGGISLQLGANTYLQLPDKHWAQDATTWAEYQRSVALSPDTAVPSTAPPDRALEGTVLQSWLKWRAQRLARFHRDLAGQVQQRRPDTRLFLLMADSIASWPVQHEMRARLIGESSFADAMLRQGFVASEYAAAKNLLLLQPRRVAPLINLSEQSADVKFGSSPQVDKFFRSARASGSLNFHEMLPLRLTDFEQKGPFDPDSTTAWLAAHIPPSGLHNRARIARSLSAFDAQVIVEGGQMLALGQEHELLPLTVAFRHLPNEPFQTVVPESPVAKSSELVVRTLPKGRETYAYVVNRSSWPVQAVLQLDAAARCGVRAIDGRPPGTIDGDEKQQSWRVALEPYDIRAVVLTQPAVKVRDWHSEPREDIDTSLTAAFRDLNARLNELRLRKPARILENASFEAAPQDGQIPGWTASQRPGVHVDVETDDAVAGVQSLHLKVDAAQTVAWVRSKPFRLPRTGRISIAAYVRTRDKEQQPALRLAVDLLANGRPFDYLYTPLGVDVDGRPLRPTGFRAEPLSKTWPNSPILFHIPELPIEGATDIVVGFDLMGEGEVWIDDVQIFDFFFDENEQNELLKNFAPANFKLTQGKFADCERYLDGYWPRFLMEYVTLPAQARMAAIPERPIRAALPQPDSQPNAAAEVKPTNWKRLVPRIPFRNPFSREDE
jgi:hypothetical protein